MNKRALGTISLLLLAAVGGAFQASAQTATPTVSPTPTVTLTPNGTATRAPFPTRTATPTNLNDTLEIDLGDDFSPDLVAAVGIGTGGQRQFLNCAVEVQGGSLFSDFGPQDVQDIPDFRVMLPSICSDVEIKAEDVRVYAPNGTQLQPAVFSQIDVDNGGITKYMAGLPLGAFLTPGRWLMHLMSPFEYDLYITIPDITQTIFLRGTLNTGILAGFKPFEQVRAFAYEAINGGLDGWRFTKSFEFGTNQFGFRVVSLNNLANSSIIFVGQQGSVYISNAAFQGNGPEQDARVITPNVIAQVWSAQPAQQGSAPTANGNVTERTDWRGVVQVYVPAGCFTMGSDVLADINNQIRGHSARMVCISQSYWIDKYEVSNAEWEQFRLDTGSPLADLPSYQTSNQPDTPRVGMTLEEAMAYAQWRGGRIPTEAEWEYAARGPNSPLYPWGDVFSGQANIYGTAGGTVPVSRYPEGVNWVGAFNMAGNAGEWVADCFDATYDAQLVTNDPVGPCYGTNEMVKGSSFGFNSYPAQSAYRFVNPIKQRWFDVGLRVVSPA